jgi:protease I
MKALIMSAPGVEDSEFLYPYYRLQEAGFEVDVAGPGTGTFTGKYGYELKANLAFTDIDPAGYDLLVIPGGKAPETVRLSEPAVEAARRMTEDRKPVAAICHGAQVLISAGVLEGKKATCWAGIRDDLKAAGAQYVDEEVVTTGNLVTSRCPDDLPAFCRELLLLVRASER